MLAPSVVRLASARALPMAARNAAQLSSRRGVTGAPSAPPHFQALPVLDYRTMESDFPQFVADMRSACCNVGFFVLAGLPPQTVKLHDDVLRVARAFFALPSEEKSRMDYCHSPQFRGYMQLGVENTAGRRDEREQIEFGREEPVPAALTDAPLFTRLRGPNQWPAGPPEFRAIVSQWLQQMEELSWSVTRALASSLGLEAHALDDLFKTPHIQAKLVHYPATEEALGVEETASLGVGAHSDSGFLTLLLQDDIGGLEVLNGSGQWVAAAPIHGSIVCNLGEVVQLLSGGSFLSTVHRVQRPPVGRGGRLSAPFFWNPSLEAVIHPLSAPPVSSRSEFDAVASERPRQEANCLIPSYGMNAFKSLARSHPEVFARHHPDLRVLPDGQVVLR
mmetsp:Transcript_19993/g.56434  ORF Transcript_19993/g.56434 Transcript_19993/m.56434 type:complete len:391 (-) Transcript_19993:33-1205(-)